jgi:hypothetical protein
VLEAERVHFSHDVRAHQMGKGDLAAERAVVIFPVSRERGRERGSRQTAALRLCSDLGAELRAVPPT